MKHKSITPKQALENYNKNFVTVYDSEITYIGKRHTSYSIVRYLDPRKSHIGEMHDLAIIWDEDHDERVYECIGLLHAQNLLAPALFIGERKASVSILLDDKLTEQYPSIPCAYYNQSNGDVDFEAIDGDNFYQAVYDWNVGVGIIQDDKKIVLDYLSEIKARWNLGVAK
jgi:hypothetical protein